MVNRVPFEIVVASVNEMVIALRQKKGTVHFAKRNETAKTH